METLINKMISIMQDANFIKAIIIIAVLYIFSPLFSYIIVKIFNWKSTEKQIKDNPFYEPIRAFFKILGLYTAIMILRPTLNISQHVIDIITKIFRIIIILNTAIGLVHSITKKSKFLNVIKEKSDKEIDDASVKMIIRFVKAVIYIIAGFMIMADLGYDLSGIITGLGLGSVVLTLAAQDTIKNLLGGFMIFMDKPFKTGDYIKYDKYEGTVEDMTFRSTRLRTVENSIAQIPNAELANSTVVNYSKMEKRRYELNLGLVLNTDLNRMADLKEKIYTYLANHENVIENSQNVYFTSVEASNYKLQIFCYINTTDYIEYLKIKENINYGIMDIVNRNGIELAYDTQTVEIKNSIK